MSNAPAPPPSDSAIARARALSRYFDHTLAAHPAELAAEEVGSSYTPATIAAAAMALIAAPDESALKAGLRALRRRVMLRVIARDLAGLAPLDEVLTTVSALADSTVGAAADWLERDFTARHGKPRGEASGAPQQLHVVAMGKMGGFELNASSDIDLVMVYPEEGQTDGARPLTNHEFFVRIAQRLTGVLSEITPDGFVFRVDNRLRPWGDAGPLAAGFDALEDYLITHGREWERFAWLKARAVRGDRTAELMDVVRPFVFRRHLDYSAIAALRALHRQIREEVTRSDRADDIKIGPGGIREIEFIVQLFQLIRGGREPE
ncbi:MAG: bifunctional [glutamate--ammonia ligase]-adenylyl-L-tyrosine phosphorylase/[glutamate--ammonia-ligase] adenylyltransferase, partial [Burkholderiales bacterium]